MAASTSLRPPIPCSSSSSSSSQSIRAPSLLRLSSSSLSSLPIILRPATLRGLSSSLKEGPPRGLRPPRRRGVLVVAAAAALGKLSEAELVPIPRESGDLEGKFPSGSGVYGIYDKDGTLQFIGISRNISASIAAHAKFVPADLCSLVKVSLVGEAEADRSVLTDAWKAWMEEHIAATGKVPPGNESGNNTWVRRPKQKPDLRLTPGRHVQLTISLEELIDRVVKDNKVVAFIKGSRSAPQCGFSQRVVGILESHKIDFESLDVLDEEHNYGLREALKKYSNWPTFPQVFVRGELVGGCDIISSMAETGELATLFRD